jgi:hypothetical protein
MAWPPMQVADLRGRIDADQRLMIQFAEEKVQLAIHGYDLLMVHFDQIEADIVALRTELDVSASLWNSCNVLFTLLVWAYRESPISRP